MGHGFPGLHRRTPHAFFNIFTNLHRRDSCLTVNNMWDFHPGGGGGGGGGGDLPQLAPPKTKHVIYHFDHLHTRESLPWTLSHFSRVHDLLTNTDE